MISLGAPLAGHYIENMKMRLQYRLMPALFALLLSCSSDPEGPIAARFVDDGTYGIKAGETHRVVIPVNATTVTVPYGVGTAAMLTIGRQQGIEFRAILLLFDLTLDEEDEGKTVSSATLSLPVEIQSPESLEMHVTFNELVSSFTEDDSISAIPPYDPEPIADSLGNTVRLLNIESTEFDLDTAVVNGWISGRRPHTGIAILWAEVPDTASVVEMNAHEYGIDPPTVEVNFTDGTSTTFGSEEDCTVAYFEQGGLNIVGGIAKRIFFTFDPVSLPEQAMVNATFLVLKVRGDQGYGASVAERLLLDYTTDFVYYLYAPDSADTLSGDFLEGTGVAQSYFDPTSSDEIKMTLRAYMADILSGKRANTGLVLQSDFEITRIQRASFATSGESAPYIEIVYSLPASFGDAP
jgi:hypothetical protein